MKHTETIHKINIKRVSDIDILSRKIGSKILPLGNLYFHSPAVPLLLFRANSIVMMTCYLLF